MHFLSVKRRWQQPHGTRTVGRRSALAGCCLILAARTQAFHVPLPQLAHVSGTHTNHGPFERRSTTLFGLHPNRQDLDVVFGSEGEEEAEQGEELFGDGYFDQEAEASRQERIQELMAQQDAKFLEERRKKQWGEFADAKSMADVAEVQARQKEKLQEENQKKQVIARQSGVEMELLEPVDDDPDAALVSGKGNVANILINAQVKKTSNWYSKVDQDLQAEWKAMEDNNDGEVKGAVSDANVQMESSGKIVSKDSMRGIRVGSAGGWTLEVFPGDFVVHRKYGIGRFERTCLRPKSSLTEKEELEQSKRRNELMSEAVKQRMAAKPGRGPLTQQEIRELQSKFGTEEDTDPISNPQTTVLEIVYSDGVVHVPIDRAYRLSRYRAGDSVVKPRLSKVKGGAWRSMKKKVEETTLQLAQDVLALYATRETLQRQPFDPSKEPFVKDFETSFAYEPTPDQKKCFEDVENDMVWRSRPMDRLVCGDVGFGKTEVANRALYRSVVNGRQAALLAPTGVLAAQHYKNLIKRLGENTKYNKKIALLRGGMGKNTKAGREIRAEIASGAIDIIVGTHALLSNDLMFADLGLLVVDEEQRFGVKQKERLKLICSGIDVLTLSATPIPRTLQMSLSGIRDTSTIRSPPPMRKPTVTYVQDFSEELVELALNQEFARGGQCYYVVPRISMLDEAEEMLTRLKPDIRIIMAHGRMARNEAEDNVAAFAEGDYDVLLATTVIENGVDIPSVNTIILQNSQAFGMSTLYQLRGRVGRSDKQAFAYFLHDPESITEQAAMRLQAIGELSELGSGFDVANRDLEIRGAGSLLGTEQSGVAAKVGFDLYMRMLKKSIRQLRGLDLPVVPRTKIILPDNQGSMEAMAKVNGKVQMVHSFQIPETFIPDAEQRAKEETAARLADTTVELVKLTNKWKETYGPLPAKLQTKLKTMHLHSCTRRLGIDLVGIIDNGDDRYDCVLRSPGLRPRHLAMILPLLPRGILTPGIEVVFPDRFTRSGYEETVVGGTKVNLKSLQDPGDDDEDSEKWDALDEEEVEAMKEISSAYAVENVDDVDIEQYPRFVVRNFGNEGTKAVDRLLKLILPSAKAAYDRQEEDKERAKASQELRERQELMAQQKKHMESQVGRQFLRR